MYTNICEQLGIDLPIFAFSHCRDVVVAVSKAGGLGVLGAGWFTPEEFREELDWIDAHIGDAPYGIDLVIPQQYEGMDETDPVALEKRLWETIPEEHLEFARKLVAEHNVPELPANEEDRPKLPGSTYATALPLFLEGLGRPNCKLLANALGTPPADIVDKAHEHGWLVGALCGKVKQAVAHRDAGLDFIIAVGGEGGGHCGEIGSVVLWPQVVDAVAPVPVLCGGGVGNGRQMLAAMAMGAAGVWTGSLWVTVEEAAEPPATKESYLNCTSEGTVRTRSWTGKPGRVIRNDWTDAWDDKETPEPLGAPQQFLVSNDAMRRSLKYAGAGDAQQVAMSPAGQVIGQINEVESCRSAIYRLMEEYIDALDHVNGLLPEE